MSRGFFFQTAMLVAVIKKIWVFYSKHTLESLLAEEEVQFEGCPFVDEVAEEVVEIEDLNTKH